LNEWKAQIEHKIQQIGIPNPNINPKSDILINKDIPENDNFDHNDKENRNICNLEHSFGSKGSGHKHQHKLSEDGYKMLEKKLSYKMSMAIDKLTDTFKNHMKKIHLPGKVTDVRVL
jgi:hypothetical protein